MYGVGFISPYLRKQPCASFQFRTGSIEQYSILDFERAWSFFFKPRRISGSANQPFLTHYRFLPDFLDCGCHVGLVGLIWRGLKQNSTLVSNPEYCSLLLNRTNDGTFSTILQYFVTMVLHAILT